MAEEAVPSAARRRSAFTLIELLIVIAVIGILMSLVFAVISAALRRAEDAKARSLVSAVESACERFNGDLRRYPWDTTGRGGAPAAMDAAAICAELRGLPGAVTRKSGEDYISAVPAECFANVGGRLRIRDPWGSDLVFRINPASGRPVIWSRGRDRIDDTNFEDPPGAYSKYTPPPAPAACSDPAKFPRAVYYLGDGKRRGDDLSNL